MTQLELDYLNRALAAIASPDTTSLARAKILQTMSEICARSAELIRQDLIAAVDQRLAAG
jgi:hypothetical protein